ncbi:MAG: hypothetical protein ACE5JN_03085 [Candidatus Methylomirabilia bacterium]
MKDVWAVFNLEIDPSNFKFGVALGAAMTGDPEPESTTIMFDSLGTRIPCQVFIERDKMQRTGITRLLRNQLKILSDISRDGLEFECQRQLSLAFRLFKPGPFWISAWERRNEVRPRFWPLPPPYVLRGEELTRFCDFSKKLIPFQEQRNIYRLVRYFSQALGEVVSDFLEPSDPTGERFLSRTAYLIIAADFFEQAHGNWWLSPDMRLVLLMIATEALFTDDDKAEVGYRLSQRIAVLNGSHPGERKTVFELTKGLYDLRSRLVHGSVYRRKRGFPEVAGPDLAAFANLVRSSLLYCIALDQRGFGKDDILKTLDRAVFDEKEMLLFRFKANEFWGFGESPDEHLYAMGGRSVAGP